MKNNCLKISVLVAFVAMGLAFTSCQKDKVTDSTFVIEISKMQSTGFWIDVVPENNDFYYRFDAISVEDYARYASDADLISSDYQQLVATYDTVMKYTPSLDISFEDLYFEVGAVAYYFQHDLKPETDYYLFAYRLDRKKRPIKTLVKVPFTTTKKPVSDITFDLSIDGEQLIITPSNDDTYFWVCDTKAVVDAEFSGSPYLMMLFTLENYYEYDFIDNMLSQGRDTLDLHYFCANVDTLQMAFVGYQGEVSTQYRFYEVVSAADHSLQVHTMEDPVYDEPSAVQNAMRKAIKLKR